VTLWRKVCHLPLTGIELLLTRVFRAVFANAVWRCGWSVSACSPLQLTCLTRVTIYRVVPANRLPRIVPSRTEGCPRFTPHNNRSALKHCTAAIFPAVSASLSATSRCHSSSPKRWTTRELTCRDEDIFLPLTMFCHPLGSTCAYRGLSRPERETDHSPP
jgi:hypothetical protein